MTIVEGFELVRQVPPLEILAALSVAILFIASMRPSAR